MYHKLKFLRPVLFLIILFTVNLFFNGCVVKETKVYKVGILSGANAYVSVGESFKSAMSGLGYLEGKNIVYDFQKVNADPAGEERAIKKFIADKVDLMFTIPTGATINAKKLTQGRIPLIFAVTTIEGSGLVQSVRRPGGNITGVRVPGADITIKRLEILMEIAKKAKRVWLAYKVKYSPAENALIMLEPAASALNITLIQAPVKSVDEIRQDLEERSKSGDPGIDAILIMPDALSQSPEAWSIISRFAALHRLPIGGNAAVQSTQGAIFTYSADYAESGKLAASLADKILKGTPAGEIPVITPEARLTINYKLIQELGLSIDDGLLNRASKIIR